jgi:hypothetical protein
VPPHQRLFDGEDGVGAAWTSVSCQAAAFPGPPSVTWFAFRENRCLTESREWIFAGPAWKRRIILLRLESNCLQSQNTKIVELLHATRAIPDIHRKGADTLGEHFMHGDASGLMCPRGTVFFLHIATFLASTICAYL